jgi:hypothetical protein
MSAREAPTRRAGRAGSLATALGLVAVLGAWVALVLVYSPSGWLVLGSTLAPHPQTASILALWSFFGVTATALAARLLYRWLEPGRQGERLEREWLSGADRRWMLVGSVIAAAGAVAVRFGILRGQAIADDEASYRFAAQLIASGRWTAESHALRPFFDHPYLVNDGRIASAYFPGWPILAAPFAALGISGLANAVYHGLSVPAVFRIARSLWGGGWARLALVLWISSPFLLALAATGLSHTTCITALAWATAWILELRAGGGTRQLTAAACALGAAFWIRPYSTLMVAIPLLLLVVGHLRRGMSGRWRRALAFLVPLVLLAVGLLAYQSHLWGSPWKTGYHRLAEVHAESQGRFSAVPKAYFEDPVPVVSPAGPSVLLARGGLGAILLSGDLLGWPAVLVAAAALLGLTAPTPFRPMLLAGLALGALQRDTGIDSFGPVHFAELGLPALLLVVAGARTVFEWPVGAPANGPGRVPTARAAAASLLAAAIVVAWIAWVPLRWRTLLAMTRQIESPVRAVEIAAAGRAAVAFATFPWVDERCRNRVPIHFRYQRPLSDPDLEDSILWVNDLGVETDRALLRLLPGRVGFRVRWREDCAGAEAVAISPPGPSS